jgi:nucleotide-binding universal stress UspA family protein
MGMQRDPHFRIVVALDLSEYSEIVLEYALDQAARHSAPDIHFVHVVDDERHAEAAKRRLEEAALSSLDTVRGPTWRARLHVRTGKPHVEIIALAAEVDAHLIVCGRFGVHRSWRNRGSVARRVLEHAHCPVLAVNLVDRPVQLAQCADCVAVRAASDGERWFCDAHSAPDRESAMMSTSFTSLPRTGGGPLW